MKITRDDIKKMVNETIVKINEANFGIRQKHFHPFWDSKSKKFTDGFNFDVFKSHYPDATESNFEKIKNDYINHYGTENFWTQFFKQYKTISYEDAVPIIKNMGHKIPTERSFDVRKANFFRDNPEEKKLRDTTQIERYREAVLSLKEWFKNNGGDSVDINDYSYPKQICDLACACPLQIERKVFISTKDDKYYQPFLDFFLLMWAKNSKTEREVINYLSNDYLKYLAYKKILSKNANNGQIKIPSEIETEENIARFYKDYGGMIKNTNVGTLTFCQNLLLELGLKKDTNITPQSVMILVNKIKKAGGYNFLLKKASEILKKINRVQSHLISDNSLSELLWVMFYIITNKMFLQFDKLPNNLYEEYPQIMRMAFGAKYYMMYGENYLKLDRLIDENNASLFSPYSNGSLNNNYICGILRNCIDLNIPQLNIKIGLPIEQIIEYWGNCYSFMTLTNTEKYGSDTVLNWENLLNPDFSAEAAMEQAGIDKFAKGKFKKSNKRGEIVNLSFYDFMMWDVKIKEKTQKEIYFFLANNTSVPWKYEYNRYDKQADEELGKKSIDIFNENYGICIEYQGHQHFRPFGVKSDDDDSIEIIHLGFKKRGMGPISNLKNELEGIVQSGKIPNNLEELIKDRLLQMCKKYIHVPFFKEAYDILQQGKDTYSIETKRGSTENHYIKQVLSVNRFLKEINVIKQKERDKIKVQAVRNKNWNMLYVLPGNKNSVNDDDIEKVKELVGDNYFYWKQDSNNLLNYLSDNYGFVKQTDSNTLFEQIVKELLK